MNEFCFRKISPFAYIILNTWLNLFLERAVMIRKLEHDREKLSSQLERSQESASQAKKIARESEKAVKTERENAARLEVRFFLILYIFRP